MDDHVKTLNNQLLTLIQDSSKAQDDLYTSSRHAEDSVRAFEIEQKERIEELAENTVTELRVITENRSDTLKKVTQELTEHLKLLASGTYTASDISRATQYVNSLNKNGFLQDNNIHFDGDLDLAESLLSVSCLGQCHLNSEEPEIASCSKSAEETEKKSIVIPFWHRSGCRLAHEHSWTPTCPSTTASVSDNNFYDKASITCSTLTLNSDKEKIKRRKVEGKILNVPPDQDLVRYVRQFKAVEHRTPCVIPDISLLSDMKVVLIDHYHNSIQLFSQDFVQLDEQSCPYPIGVCRLPENKVAVSLRRQSQVVVFEVKQGKLEQQRSIKIKCNSYLWQVTYKSSQLFVVCDENDIHVLDITGQEFRVIRSGVSPEQGYLRYFDVNENKKHIYLSERRGLRCINFKGKLQWLFGNEDFPEEERDKQGHAVEDVCYANGVILGTRWTLSKVFQISTDGKFLRNIIIDHLEHPRVMSMLGNRLVVTQFHPVMKQEQQRTVKVFESCVFECGESVTKGHCFAREREKEQKAPKDIAEFSSI